jgi:hypothetical protein
LKNKVTALVLALAASAAWGIPNGISGPAVGFGGVLGDMAFVGGEYDFAYPPYITWGPEAMLAFGGGVGIMGGVAGRVYIIPNYNYLAQPYFAGGAGFGVLFDDDGEAQPPPGEEDKDTHPGGYIHFGAGNDFDIPNTAIVPYIDLGGLVFISDNTDAYFKIEIGIRFGM